MIEEAAAAPVQQEASAGTLLRRAREATGLHVAALAVALKVPVRKLEALEEDRYDELGDAVFIRGLASSVCRTLKADPQPILARLPQAAAPRLVKDTEGLNAPFHAPGDGPAPTWVDRVRQPVPATVLALLVGAVVIYFLPAARHEAREEQPVAQAPAAAAAPIVVPAAAASESAPIVQSQVTPAAPESVPAKAAVAAPAPAATQRAQPAASAASPSPSPLASASSTPTAVPTTGIVVVRAKGESWVEVVDAHGGVPLRKLLTGGEVVGASGALPLTVTVGKVDVTEVDVRGKKFDLRPVSKDNVARFTVK